MREESKTNRNFSQSCATVRLLTNGFLPFGSAVTNRLLAWAFSAYQPPPWSTRSNSSQAPIPRRLAIRPLTPLGSAVTQHGGYRSFGLKVLQSVWAHEYRLTTLGARDSSNSSQAPIDVRLLNSADAPPFSAVTYFPLDCALKLTLWSGLWTIVNFSHAPAVSRLAASGRVPVA